MSEFLPWGTYGQNIVDKFRTTRAVPQGAPSGISRPGIPVGRPYGGPTVTNPRLLPQVVPKGGLPAIPVNQIPSGAIPINSPFYPPTTTGEKYPQAGQTNIVPTLMNIAAIIRKGQERTNAGRNLFGTDNSQQALQQVRDRLSGFPLYQNNPDINAEESVTAMQSSHAPKFNPQPHPVYIPELSSSQEPPEPPAPPKGSGDDYKMPAIPNYPDEYSPVVERAYDTQKQDIGALSGMGRSKLQEAADLFTNYAPYIQNDSSPGAALIGRMALGTYGQAIAEQAKMYGDQAQRVSALPYMSQALDAKHRALATPELMRQKLFGEELPSQKIANEMNRVHTNLYGAQAEAAKYAISPEGKQALAHEKIQAQKDTMLARMIENANKLTDESQRQAALDDAYLWYSGKRKVIDTPALPASGSLWWKKPAQTATFKEVPIHDKQESQVQATGKSGKHTYTVR